MVILRIFIVLISALAFSLSVANNAEALEDSELIRASIIEKIANFIEWPDLKEEQFTICAFDNTPLLPALEAYYANSFFNQKPIKLVTFNQFKRFSECQIIYLGIAERIKLETILTQIEGQPILVVTEKKDDVSRGAHVDFFVEENRLRLEINRTALSKNHLKASYHLLGVARIVE